MIFSDSFFFKIRRISYEDSIRFSNQGQRNILIESKFLKYFRILKVTTSIQWPETRLKPSDMKEIFLPFRNMSAILIPFYSVFEAKINNPWGSGYHSCRVIRREEWKPDNIFLRERKLLRKVVFRQARYPETLRIHTSTTINRKVVDNRMCILHPLDGRTSAKSV